MVVDVDPRVGTSIAGYRLDEQVGRGGMGVVFRAHDDALERSVALKLVAPELASDVAFRDRFLVEARLAASLDHPNVVPVYDAGAIDGQLYLAMRFVEGSDLREVVAEGSLEPGRALEVCGQVAQALDAAHRRGLVHRDVKPSNVLLDTDGHAYLADFGLTRRLSEQAPGFDAGLSLGTPAYVAPEQIESAGGEHAVVGPRADQYSLACMLYECLTGEPPFPRSSEAATLFAHLEEEPPTLPRLEAVLGRGLAKDPDDRFESCTAFVDAARDAFPPTRRRRRGLLVAAVAALTTAATVAAVIVATGDDGPRVGHDWSKVPHNEDAFGGTQQIAPVGIDVGESGLIAIGTSGAWEEGGDSDLTVWTSPDGVNWTLSSDSSLAQPGWQFPDDVIATEDGFVAVGSELLELPAGYPNLDYWPGVAAVWLSKDGSSWEQVLDDADLLGGRDKQHLADVDRNGSLLVAVGADDGINQAAVWTSRDGAHWSRVPPDSSSFGATSPRGDPAMRRVAVTDDGRVAAIGFEYRAESDRVVAAVWASSDGSSWNRAPHDGEIFGGESSWDVVRFTAIAGGGPGFVAATSETKGGGSIEGVYTQTVLAEPGPSKMRARILLSEDGLIWTAVPVEQLPDRGDRTLIRDLIRGGPGFVAVGWRRNNPGVADADIDPVVWVSPDGEHWAAAADPKGVFSQPGGQLIEQIVVGGPGLVAIGQDGGVNGYNAAIWTSP